MNYFVAPHSANGKVIDADASGSLQVSELVQGWFIVRSLERSDGLKWQELRSPKTHGIRAWSYLVKLYLVHPDIRSIQIPFFRILFERCGKATLHGEKEWKRTCVAFASRRFSGDNVSLGIGLQFWHRSGREAWRSNDQRRTEPPKLKDGARCCLATKRSVQMRLMWSQSAASERWLDMAWP